MTKPILFKPGDVLTAEQINKYLVENLEEQKREIAKHVKEMGLEELRTRLAPLLTKAAIKQSLAGEIRVKYDYDN